MGDNMAHASEPQNDLHAVDANRVTQRRTTNTKSLTNQGQGKSRSLARNRPKLPSRGSLSRLRSEIVQEGHHRRLTAIASALQGGQQVTYGSNEKVTLRGGLFGFFRA